MSAHIFDIFTEILNVCCILYKKLSNFLSIDFDIVIVGCKTNKFKWCVLLVFYCIDSVKTI